MQEFIEREQEIVNRIVAKFEELNPIIPMDTYTIDFCVDPDSDKVWVVELNNPVFFSFPIIIYYPFQFHFCSHQQLA